MSQSKLHLVEVLSLKRFRFVEKINENCNSISYVSLMQPDELERILVMISEKIGTNKLRVAASILTKRMSFYAVIHFYSMTVLNKRLIPEKVLLVEDVPTDLWLPDFYFGNFGIEEEGSDRLKWRDDILQHVFIEILSPLIRALSKQVKLSERVMWENIVRYIIWLYDELIQSKQIKRKASEDFHYLIQTAQGSLFGYETNPLTRFYSEHTSIRKTCCLAYLLDSSSDTMCSTCPITVYR